MVFRLVDEGDTVIWPEVAAQQVAKQGVKSAAAYYGVSEGKLRHYLNTNGWHGKRSTRWERADVPQVLAETPQVPPVADEDPQPS